MKSTLFWLKVQIFVDENHHFSRLKLNISHRDFLLTTFAFPAFRKPFENRFDRLTDEFQIYKARRVRIAPRSATRGWAGDRDLTNQIWECMGLNEAHFLHIYTYIHIHSYVLWGSYGQAWLIKWKTNWAVSESPAGWWASEIPLTKHFFLGFQPSHGWSPTWLSIRHDHHWMGSM